MSEENSIPEVVVDLPVNGQEEENVKERILTIIQEYEQVEAPVGEAGFAINFRISSPFGVDHQFTFRGRTSADWPLVMKEVTRIQRYLMVEKPEEQRWFASHPQRKNAVAQTVRQPTTQTVTKEVETVSNQSGLQPVNVEVNDPADPGGDADPRGNVPGQLKVFKVAQLKITPNANGTAKVEFLPFLSDGSVGQYAEVIETRKTPQDWVAEFSTVLPGWNEQMFMAAAMMPVNGELECLYKISDNKTKNGYYYKNYIRLQKPQKQ